MTTQDHPEAISLRAVRVEGRRDTMLDPVTLRLERGTRLLVVAEPGHGHTALALVATGRMVPDEGDVLLDGIPDPATLRRVSVVVDAPSITEPDDALTVAGTVAEGLALAGRPAGRRAVARWLAEHDLTEQRSLRVDQMDPATRVRTLLALGAADPGVRYLVLTLPDRHGGNPKDWWQTAEGYAASGYGVLVQCTPASAHVLETGRHIERPVEGTDNHDAMEVLR